MRSVSARIGLRGSHSNNSIEKDTKERSTHVKMQ